MSAEEGAGVAPYRRLAFLVQRRHAGSPAALTSDMRSRVPAAGGDEIERVVARLRQTPARGTAAPEFHALLVEYRRVVQERRARGGEKGAGAASSPMDTTSAAGPGATD